ncbi:MAG: hypothetical protein U0997_00905 [Sulfurimicrobium sp.]|nr:hypothetical protein [Sulfurimicrobium sp.]
MQLKNTLRKATILGIGLTVVATLSLSGCDGGGGDSTPATSALSGTAAIGSPIVSGTVSVICVAGSAIAPTTTSSTGAWQITLTGQTLPCAVQLSGGTINNVPNTMLYHSIATSTGTVNITPLTDLMVANLAGTATPGAWFSGLNAAPSALTAITQSKVNETLTKLRIALNGLPLSTINPINTTFTPTPGNVSDDILAALNAAMISTGVTHEALLNSASMPAFTSLVTGFDAALTSAYRNTASGGGGTGGGTGGETGGGTGGETGGGTGGETSGTASCNSTATPAGMNYSQTGNTITVTTTGCISVPAAGMCNPSSPQETGINVLSTSSLLSFQMTGISFNIPGLPDPFTTVGSALAASKQCIANAPAELQNLSINFDVCYDMTSQMASSVNAMQSTGMITVTNPITGRAKGSTMMQTVADCVTSGADTITDAFTGKIFIKQANGTYSKIN